MGRKRVMLGRRENNITMQATFPCGFRAVVQHRHLNYV